MNMNTIQERKQPQSQKQLTILLAGLLVVAIAVGGAAIGMTLASRNVEMPQAAASGGVGLTVDPNAGTYVAPAASEASTQGVAIPGWGSITIAADQTDIIVDFYNPEANEDLYYLTFELRLPDESEQGYEVLYTSGLVEPGLHLQQISLSRSLAAGEYDAVIHVQPYRMDEDCTPTNNADMNTQLIAQ
jgi:flagellar basal body-associated protein FliL